MKIAVLTGSRSEYGLLEPLIKIFHEAPDVELQLFVTGSHLSPYFGNTVDEIHFPISERIEILLASDTQVGINKAMGLAMIAFGEAYERHHPDVLIVLGDRFESFCAACAAHVSGIPIAHIHGGELTEGSMDDAFRHSITQMASLHFPAADAFAKRVVQLGGHPSTVFAVGAIGCVGLVKRDTTQWDNVLAYVAHYSIEGLDEISSVLTKKSIQCFWMMPVADIGANEVRNRIKSLGGNYIENLPRKTFLESLSSHASFLIGNSSAGIIEAPCLGVPSINVGDRQKGRPQAASVIQADPTERGISGAINNMLLPEFQALMESDYLLHYKGGRVAEQIAEIILRETSGLKGARKRFYDIKW